MAITSVGQEYESTEGHYDYKTSTGTTYGGQGQPMDIGKSNDNFKDGKPKCFNCNNVKIVDGGLYFISSFHFILFYFTFFFFFLFLEQLRLGSISHAVTSVTN